MAGSDRVALVTGASRGIGAATAAAIALDGTHVVISYREKRPRAEKVALGIRKRGGSATTIGADITEPGGIERLVEDLRADHGHLDALVLNASGGLELSAGPEYAMSINRDAQLNLVNAFLPLMPAGARIVFVTSHQAHFHGRKAVPAEYEPIAASKRAGETALRRELPRLAELGIGMSVVSGDMIDDTIIVRLLERRNSEAVAARRRHGELPTVEQFAEAVANESRVRHHANHTVYIGGDDYLAS